MYELIRPIRTFFLLFQVAKPVPSRSLLPGLILLCVWHLSYFFAPEVSLHLAVSAAFVTFLALQLPIILPRMSLVMGSWLSAFMALCIATLPLIHLSGTDGIGAQRILTIAPLVIAAVYATAIMDRSGAILRVLWPDRRMEALRDDVARVMMMKQLALAVLNETLIVALSPDLWLVFAALLPVAWHYVTSALTTSVFLSHQTRS